MIINHDNLDESHFINCTNTFENRKDHFLHVLSRKTIPGYLIEFGVSSGWSIRAMAKTLPNETFYGFDTFTGLPEDWVRSKTLISKKGKSSRGGRLPDVPKNVKLVKGLFQDTLPTWLKHHPEQFSFVHIDSDLYSAAKCIFDTCNDRLVPGTVIVFDELGVWDKKHANNPQKNYEYWEEHEWKALKEWLEDYNREIEPISRTGGSSAFAQAGIKVIK